MVVAATSILTSRRRRRVKTDRIDGETLVCTLMAFKRGEPPVCSMDRAPTPQEEDRRRVCRERRTLVGERVKHVNRIKGLLFVQGIFGIQFEIWMPNSGWNEKFKGDGNGGFARSIEYSEMAPDLI
jgi:transposase